MKCGIMCYFIWVYTVCESTRLGVSHIQRVNNEITALNGLEIRISYYVNHLESAPCAFRSVCPHKSKKGGKDQESIQSSTIPDLGYQWESDNVTIRYHKRGSRGQPFPSR